MSYPLGKNLRKTLRGGGGGGGGGGGFYIQGLSIKFANE